MPRLGPPLLPVRFYRSISGTELVRDWLKKLTGADRRTIGADLFRIQSQWPVGMPLCRSLGDGLWELRSNLPGNRTARILFFIYDGSIGAVHAFIKKTQTTPREDLELARRRMKEMLR
jgi:phage-related protein